VTDTLLYSKIESNYQHPSIQIADYLHERRFCAWAVRERYGRRTKVPFKRVQYGYESEAKSNDPSTWLTATDAVPVAEALAVNNGNGGVGIGIFLGEIDVEPGYRLGGVDLDTCVGTDGSLTTWAVEAIERLHSYTEMSPSGTGYKILFLYRTEDIPCITTMMGTPTGKQYKDYGNGKDHPPGLEFYITKRFFALTANHYDKTPETVNTITYADFEWLVRDLGPRIARKATPRSYPPVDTGNEEPTLPSATPPSAAQTPRAGGYDQSRSGRALTRARQLRRVEGLVKYQEIKDAMLHDPDPGVRDWMNEKGLANSEREFHRIFDKSKPNTFSDEIRCEYAQAQRQVRLGLADDPWDLMT
jgi:putative DNA primase/helicase